DDREPRGRAVGAARAEARRRPALAGPRVGGPHALRRLPGSLMVELTRVYHFSAAHQLRNLSLSPEQNAALYGDCHRPHGHNYYLEVTVAGRLDPVTGMAVDLTRLDRAVSGAVLVEEYDEMVIVKDIDFFSLCVPSKQIVNAVGGAKPAREVKVGDRLWTLDQGYLKETGVTQVTSRKTREIVEVRTTGGSIRLTPDHPLMTESGWQEAQDLGPGTKVEWINPRSLCRQPYQMTSGYPLGYVLGAVAADGSIQQGRRINLTVKRAEFAEKYRAMFADAFPGSEPAIERVTVPSSFLK